MRIVVTGATGNVGTSVVAALANDPEVDEIVGIARRLPSLAAAAHALGLPPTSSATTCVAHFEGADAVIHLAWLIQPSRDEAELERVNVRGSQKVFEAAAHAGVGALVHASSIGVYSPGPKDRAVDESWPREGVATSFYSRHKAAAEHILDRVEAANPALRVVRLRPAPDLQARGGARDPAAVRGSVAARPPRRSPLRARPAAATAGWSCSACTAPTSVRPTAWPRSRRTRAARTTSPPTRCSTARRSGARSGPGWSTCRRARCASSPI